MAGLPGKFRPVCARPARRAHRPAAQPASLAATSGQYPRRPPRAVLMRQRRPDPAV